ncbi:MAG: response regulator [Elusimicrobiota bacterium]|nr:response regulator [Elusimicrobiota bacterium]
MNKKKILIAEDDSDVMTVLGEGLDGYEIVSAYDGRDAWEKTKETVPDLILLDIMMPAINGAELNKKFKKDKKLKDIPVIIITGRPNMEGLFSDSGPNRVEGFLEKPFTLKVLKAEIERVLD